MNRDLPNFYPPNILLDKYYMANRQFFTLQTSIYSTNNYTSLTYKNGANRRDDPRNVSNYCGSLLYSNGRRIVRISYLPFAIKQFTITGSIPNIVINMISLNHGLHRKLVFYPLTFTHTILIVRPIYVPAAYSPKFYPSKIFPCMVFPQILS